MGQKKTSHFQSVPLHQSLDLTFSPLIVFFSYDVTKERYAFVANTKSIWTGDDFANLCLTFFAESAMRDTGGEA